MSKMVWRFLALIVVIGSFSLAQSPLLNANPCDADSDRVCSDVRPGMGAVGQCLEKYWDDLSYGCRNFLDKQKSKLKELQNACLFDARDFCGDVRPGYGRIKSCLNENLDKLSQLCQDKLKGS